MTRDLFLALLAMDSYNRGYGQGTLTNTEDDITNVDETNRRLGNAKIVLQSDVEQGRLGVEAGFYAIAYDVSDVEGFGDDEIVIAYRGSDYDPDACGDIWLGRQSNGRRPLRGRFEKFRCWQNLQESGQTGSGIAYWRRS